MKITVKAFGLGAACGLLTIALLLFRSSPKRPPNLIVICIDSLRADHLGCYGCRRSTSPRIDALAGSGIVFENARSNSSFTRESVAVIMSGLLPSSGGAFGWFAKPLMSTPVIGEIFKGAGYRTGFFAASNMMNAPGFVKGFDAQFHDAVKHSGNGPPLSRRAIEFITANRKRPFMVYLHYLDPHIPYTPPDEFYHRFSPRRFPDPVDLKSDIRQVCLQLRREGFGPGEPRYEDMILRYDSEIAHTDHAVGMVLDALKKLRLLDSTLIVLTADHGEEFLEHRYVVHGWTLFRESTHVPLIFWGPMIATPRRAAFPASSVDILPTVLSLLKIPYRRYHFDGSPLFSADMGKTTFFPDRRPYIGELLIQHRNIVRAVASGDWKYLAAVSWTPPENRPRRLPASIETLEKDRAWRVDPWGPVQYEALFDISRDPGEQNDVLAANPGKRNELRAILAGYESRCRESSRKRILDNAGEIPLDEANRSKLKALGYL